MRYNYDIEIVATGDMETVKEFVAELSNILIGTDWVCQTEFPTDDSALYRIKGKGFKEGYWIFAIPVGAYTFITDCFTFSEAQLEKEINEFMAETPDTDFKVIEYNLIVHRKYG